MNISRTVTSPLDSLRRVKFQLSHKGDLKRNCEYGINPNASQDTVTKWRAPVLEVAP
jgi:hypothetical protein